MGLADRYKEELKKQGIDVKIDAYRPPKYHDKVIAFLIIVIIGTPFYYLVYNNYRSCTLFESPLPSINGSVISTASGLKCGTNTILYSVVIAIFIVICVLLFLKIRGVRRLGMKSL